MDPARDGTRMSVADYLEAERTSEVRHEYVNGAVFAMAGGSLRHSAVCTNIGAALVVALRGRPCRVFQSDARVHVAATGMYTYPDVAVICGAIATDATDPHAATNPRLIVEVLSPATEAYDRGAKFRHYQSIASLDEYVLIDPDERRVERYRRVREPVSGTGQWLLTTYASGVVELESIDARVELDAIYEKLEGLAGS